MFLISLQLVEYYFLIFDKGETFGCCLVGDDWLLVFLGMYVEVVMILNWLNDWENSCPVHLLVAKKNKTHINFESCLEKHNTKNVNNTIVLNYNGVMTTPKSHANNKSLIVYILSIINANQYLCLPYDILSHLVNFSSVYLLKFLYNIQCRVTHIWCLRKH